MKNIIDFQFEHYAGKQLYYPHQKGDHIIFLSDGCKYVADQAQAYWLFDRILSSQYDKRLNQEPLQLWTLKKQEKGWLLTCTDAHDTILLLQFLNCNSFPLLILDVYVIDGMCMLASEYSFPTVCFQNH